MSKHGKGKAKAAPASKSKIPPTAIPKAPQAKPAAKPAKRGDPTIGEKRKGEARSAEIGRGILKQM